MIACLPDTHIRVTAPINRREKNFFLVTMGKLKQIFDHKFPFVVLPGDVFDNDSKTPLWVPNRVIEFIQSYAPTEVLAVYGQHDLENHTVRETTPLYNLELAGAVTVPSMEEPFEDSIHNIRFYGLSWDDSDDLLNETEIPDDGMINVLITHRMMIKDKPEWKDQKYYSKSRMFLRNNDFDLVISGDNHSQFTAEVQDSDFSHGRKVMINSGALIRTGADYDTYLPCFHVFYPENGNYQRFNLETEPFGKVYNYEKYKRKKKKDINSSEFVSNVKGIKRFSIDFRSNLNQAIESSELGEGAKKELNNAKENSIK